jgi:hypothetical protein
VILVSCARSQSDRDTAINALGARVAKLESQASPLSAELNCQNRYFKVVAVRSSSYAFEVQCLAVNNRTNPPELLLKILNPYANHFVGLQGAVQLRDTATDSNFETRFEFPMLDPGIATGLRVNLEPGHTPDPSRCVLRFTTWGSVPSPDSADLEIATPLDGPPRVFRAPP